LLELAEHSFDAVAVPVAAIVGMLWHLAVRAGRDDRQMPRISRLSRKRSPS
jgi:hypothetical protein